VITWAECSFLYFFLEHFFLFSLQTRHISTFIYTHLAASCLVGRRNFINYVTSMEDWIMSA
jgi:hypothetical protein